MADQGPTDRDEPSFERPWEANNVEEESSADEADESADVLQLPGLAAETGESDEPRPDDSSDDVDWEAMAEGSPGLEAYGSDEYVSATTQEYQGLAEEVTRASQEEWEKQAVAATLPGVGSGLVGFEDVGGAATDSEESYEAAEQAATSDLTMRIASALIIFGLFAGSLLLGGWWFTTFVILVMVVAVGELYATLRLHGYRPLALFGLLGVALMGVGAHSWGPEGLGGWGAVIAGMTVLFFSITPRKSPLENASVTILGMAWSGMLAFAILVAKGPHPVAYIMFLVLLIALNDIGAYFVGRAFGRRKLAPELSPNKTVEGFIGGLLVGAIAASVLVTFPAWEEIGLTNGLIAAGVVGLFGPLGDLVESMVKRSIDVKDMGSILPGHGGMLDRIDSFLFAVPALYILFRAFGLL